MLTLIGYTKEEYWGRSGRDPLHASRRHPVSGIGMPDAHAPVDGRGHPLRGGLVHPADGTFYPFPGRLPIDLPSGAGSSFRSPTSRTAGDGTSGAGARRRRDRADVSRAAGRRIPERLAAENRGRRVTSTTAHSSGWSSADQPGARSNGRFRRASAALDRLDGAIADARTAIEELRKLSAGITLRLTSRTDGGDHSARKAARNPWT